MNRYFEIILREAAKAAAQGEVPVGALVLREGQILAVAHNEREKTQQLLTHAELLAMERATLALRSWRLTGCTLFTTLEPCILCLAAASQARVKRVVYGALDPKSGALSLGFRLDNHPQIPHKMEVEYVEVKECQALLVDFFKTLRKKS